FSINSNNQLELLLSSTGSNTESFTTTTTIEDTEWHHVAFTFDGSQVVIYLDGRAIKTQAASTVNSIYAGAFPLRIGYRSVTSPYYFSGTLDEVKVYSIALTREQ